MRGRIETETRIRNTISFVWKIFTSILWSRMENSKYHLFRTKYIYIDCDPQNSRLRLEDSNFHIRLRILSSRVREEKILIFKYTYNYEFYRKNPQNSKNGFQFSNTYLYINNSSSRVTSRIETETRIRNTISFVWKIFTSILWSRMEN